MGKALRTVGAVIGAAALIATGAGAMLMPGMAGATTMFGVSVGTLNTVSAGLMAVGGMLDKPDSMGSGTPDEWNSNPDQPTPFAFGRVGCSGKIIHRDEYGKDNKLQGIVSVYSGAGPIKSFVSYKVNDLPVSFTSNGGTANGKYNRQMWRSWRLGNQPDAALSLPTGLDEGAVMPAWGPAYRLSGKACELLTVQQDSKFSVYPMGLPTPKAVIEGIYGYDPRYDSTYPGGFGDCRLGVPSTYRWINNGIIAALNWALGLVENGHVVGGIGASAQGIDMPAFVEAANVSDANGWTVSAWPDSSEDVSTILKQLLQAGGASYARHAGKISCVSRGAAKPSIVTVTGRDTCGPIELDTGASLYNRINTITPSFMSEAHGWKHVPADPVTFEALRTEDGGKRGDQITYRFADNARQAGQLAAYDILDAREPFSGTIPFKPHLRRLKRGDCFDLDEPGFLLDGVKCMVLGRTYNAQTGEVRVAFRSETDGKHPLALGKTTTMPEYPVLTPADPTLVSPPLPDDWVLIPKLPNETGVQVPIIDIVGEVSNSTATAVHFEWTFDVDGVPSLDWISAGIWPPTVTSISVPADPGSWIWIGASYLRGENFSERQPYGPIQVPALVADDTIHLNGEPVQDILDKLTDVEALSASNALAVADLDGRVDDTITAAEAAIAAGEAANLAALKAGEAGEAANASNISAGIASTKADEAGNHAMAANAERLLAEAAKDGADSSANASVLAAAQASAAAGEAGDWAEASEGSAVQAGAHAADGLAYRNQSVDARDGAVVASLAAGTSASAAQDAEAGAAAENAAAQNAAATAITQASNAGAAASSAQISADLAAKSGAQNEWNNADLSQGLSGFTQQWGAESGDVELENCSGAHLTAKKFGGGIQDPGQATMGSVAFGGGPFGPERTSYNMRSWRVVAGERIGIAFDALDESTLGGNPSARWAIGVRIFNEDGSLWGGVPGADFQSEYGRAEWHRVGSVFTVPASGYLTVEAYLHSLGPTASTAILSARHFIFARMREDATEIPAFTAPAGGGALSDISAQLNITAAVATSTADQVGSARLNVTGGAGGDPFDLELQAGPEGSTASLTATALRLKNIINGMVHRVMDIVDGFVHIMGPLYIGPNREIELNPISGYPFISIRVGAGRIAMGRLPNDNLIYWFGPFQEVVNMRKSNATEWRDTNGRAYFGGQILAGTISNSAQGSNTAVPASVTLGPFSTNGAPIAIVWSYDFTRQGERWGKQDTTVTGSTSAVVRLYRKIGAAAVTLVDTQVINGAHTINYEGEDFPGQPSGTHGKTFFTEYAGGSRTYTDNVGGTQQRIYRVEVATRANISVAGDSAFPDETRQGYGAVSSE